MNTEYVLVPRKMTPEMREAVAKLKLQRLMDFMQNRDDKDTGGVMQGIVEEWETALAAAPALPAVEAMTTEYVLRYYAGNIRGRGCSCCSNPTMRWRVKVFRYLWMARLARWWITHGPMLGMQVLIGGRLNPRIRRKR